MRPHAPGPAGGALTLTARRGGGAVIAGVSSTPAATPGRGGAVGSTPLRTPIRDELVSAVCVCVKASATVCSCMVTKARVWGGVRTPVAEQHKDSRLMVASVWDAGSGLGCGQHTGDIIISLSPLHSGRQTGTELASSCQVSAR